MTESKAKKLIANFELEKETTNKVRYKEVGTDNLMGYAYLDKDALKGLGNPKKISVVITPA